MSELAGSWAAMGKNNGAYSKLDFHFCDLLDNGLISPDAFIRADSM
jgi:hypothetical protein